SDALVVQCVLAIQSEDAHASHFWIRDIASEGTRALDKYLDHLGDIRYLQDYIVERAEREEVPVIWNQDREGATSAVLDLVLTGAERIERVSWPKRSKPFQSRSVQPDGPVFARATRA